MESMSNKAPNSQVSKHRMKGIIMFENCSLYEKEIKQIKTIYTVIWNSIENYVCGGGGDISK